MRFEGTSAYVATDDLKVAVNAAIALERPLLVKGEPGTGKTVLAIEIAKALAAPLIEWHVKSTTKALQGLYEYDAVTRLRDSQLGDARVKDIRNYIKRGKLWDAFASDERPVLLIDEIDAPTLPHLVDAGIHADPGHHLVAPNSIRSEALELLLRDVRAGKRAEVAALAAHERMTEM